MDIEKKKKKLAEGDFTWDDLSDWVKERSVKGSKVLALKKDQWVLIGKTQVLLKGEGDTNDLPFAKLVTRPHNPWLNWISLPIAKEFDEGESVMDWHSPASASVIINSWFVGDASGVVFLVTEAK